jgi:hypothetical protein
MAFIKPTVGRVVHYHRRKGEDPTPAIITKVWSDEVVNLGIFNEDGSPMQTPPTSIRLVQSLAEAPSSGAFCVWMEYQKGQAAKTEEVEAVAEAARKGFYGS